MGLDMDFVINTCKMGKGAETCIYIGAGPNGIECQKLTPLGVELKKRADNGLMSAQGDNCDGVKSD